MSAYGAPSVMIASMLLSWVSLAVSDDSTAALSVPFTYILVTVPAEPEPCLTPAPLSPSWIWPWVWTTHRTCLSPALAIRWPAAMPAIVSSWPKYSRAPQSCQLAKPALNMTTGIPAATACLIVGHSAPGLGSVTAMPLTWLLIAAVISAACLVGSSLLEYLSVTLSLDAAAFAPLRILSQKVSPGEAWVIMAIV